MAYTVYLHPLHPIYNYDLVLMCPTYDINVASTATIYTFYIWIQHFQKVRSDLKSVKSYRFGFGVVFTLGQIHRFGFVFVRVTFGKNGNVI